MKKKQKKAKKTQKHFDKISCGELTNSFPTQLRRDNLFLTPIWYEYEPAFVKKFKFDAISFSPLFLSIYSVPNSPDQKFS